MASADGHVVFIGVIKHIAGWHRDGVRNQAVHGLLHGQLADIEEWRFGGFAHAGTPACMMYDERAAYFGAATWAAAAAALSWTFSTVRMRSKSMTSRTRGVGVCSTSVPPRSLNR